MVIYSRGQKKVMFVETRMKLETAIIQGSVLQVSTAM